MGKHDAHPRFAERVFIQLSLERQSRPSDIARSLDRPPCTVSRALSRSGRVNPSGRPVRRGRPVVAGGYRAVSAQRRADSLLDKARKSKKLAEGGGLWRRVALLLREYHSPEQISGMLKRMNPDDDMLRVSHETIYTAIYAVPRGELRKELGNRALFRVLSVTSRN